MNPNVAQLAQALADAIAQSPEYIAMRATEDAAGQDQALSALFDRYHALRAQVEKLSMEKEPDFDAIGSASRDLETAQEEIKTQPMYATLQSARQNFSALMRSVNDTLSATLNPDGPSGGCGGNCSGCSGCS